MRNRLIIGIILVLLIIGITIGATYAFFQYNKTGAKTLSFETGSINLNLGEVGNGISLTDQFPMSDEAGMAQATTYNFTISGYNTGTDPIYYEVLAVLGSDVVGKTRFSDDEMKLYITDGVGTPVYGPASPLNLSSAGARLLIDTIPSGTSQGSPIIRSYLLRFWLNTERILISDTDYVSGKNTYTPTEFQSKYASIKIQVKGDMTPKSMPPTLLEKINTDLSGNLYTEAGDTDQTFIVGTVNDVNYKPNNYLWYSGKMWRIVALNKTAGVVTSVKTITQDSITSMSWNGTLENGGSGGTNYQNSFIYQWLNEDFGDTLRYPTNYLVTNYSWNATPTHPSTKPSNTIMVSGIVGLLNIYEYARSATNTTVANGYLNIGHYWWSITNFDSTSVRYVATNGASSSVGYANTNYSVRPSINLKTSIRITSGSGTINNPYRLEGDNDQESNLINNNLNTRYSGEYVRFNNENYRIIEIKNSLTKLIKIDYLTDSGGTIIEKPFSTSILYNPLGEIGYWGGYLNNNTASGWYGSLGSTWQNMIEEGVWYLATVGDGISYKAGICATVNPIASGGTKTRSCIKTTSSVNAKVGLSRLGEIFASRSASNPESSSEMTIITPKTASSLYSINSTGYASNVIYSDNTPVRLSIYLKSNVKIASGDGTPTNPFTLTM